MPLLFSPGILGPSEPALELDAKEFEQVLAVNTNGVFYVAQAAGRQSERGTCNLGSDQHYNMRLFLSILVATFGNGGGISPPPSLGVCGRGNVGGVNFGAPSPTSEFISTIERPKVQ